MPSHVVSLTFDDALDSHVDVAMPLLEAHGCRGTFFVNASSECLGRRADEWRQAASRGHELGNHTLLHPATGTKSWVSEGIALEHYSLDRMRVELLVANNVLRMLDGRTDRTFAYPCSNPTLGRPGWATRGLRLLTLDRTRLMGWVRRWPRLDFFSRTASYEPLVRERFLAARIGGNRYATGAEFPPPRHAVPSIAADGRSGGELTGIVDDFSQEQGGWLVFMFHDIGGKHRLSCDEHALRQLLDCVRQKDMAVMTFGAGANLLFKA